MWSGGFDLAQKFGVTIQHLEQLHQGQRRLGLAVFVAREGIDAAAEDFGGFALVKCELLAHVDDEARIDDGRDGPALPNSARYARRYTAADLSMIFCRTTSRN